MIPPTTMRMTRSPSATVSSVGGVGADRRRERREPRSGDADMTRHRFTDGVARELRGVEEPVDIDSRGDAHRVEGVDEVLDREIAGGTRCEGTTAEPAECGVDAVDAHGDGGERVRDAKTARVV